MMKSLPAAVLAFAPLLLPQGATAEPVPYTLTKEYGSVLFRVMQQDFLYLIGRFDDFSGQLLFDPDDLESARLTATVEMGSLDMTDDDTVELLTSSRVWFNTQLYPDATFETTAVEVTGDDSVDFHGDLTFVGATLPWTLSATFHGGSDGELAGDTVGMTATGHFNRSDFGLDQYMNVAADEVRIEVNVKFERD